MSHLAKKLYQTNLNWYGDTYEFYAWAHSEEQAKMFSFKQLAKRLKKTLSFINMFFYEKKCSISIKEVMPG